MSVFDEIDLNEDLNTLSELYEELENKSISKDVSSEFNKFLDLSDKIAKEKITEIEKSTSINLKQYKHEKEAFLQNLNEVWESAIEKSEYLYLLAIDFERSIYKDKEKDNPRISKCTNKDACLHMLFGRACQIYKKL